MGDAQGEAKATGQISSRLTGVPQPAFLFFLILFLAYSFLYQYTTQESIRVTPTNWVTRDGKRSNKGEYEKTDKKTCENLEKEAANGSLRITSEVSRQ